MGNRKYAYGAHRIKIIQAETSHTAMIIMAAEGLKQKSQIVFRRSPAHYGQLKTELDKSEFKNKGASPETCHRNLVRILFLIDLYRPWGTWKSTDITQNIGDIQHILMLIRSSMIRPWYDERSEKSEKLLEVHQKKLMLQETIKTVQQILHQRRPKMATKGQTSDLESKAVRWRGSLACAFV